MPNYAIGDIHADPKQLEIVLRKADIIDSNGSWKAGTSKLICTGDLTDRGYDSIGVIKTMMKLQLQAAAVGGEVESLMGNHDALILSAAWEVRGESADPECMHWFAYNGGRYGEAEALAQDDELFDWLSARPMMLLVDDTLLQHADTVSFYLKLGDSIEAINAKGAELSKTPEGCWWIFDYMTDKRCRDWDLLQFNKGAELVKHIDDYMELMGVDYICHGHTRFKGNEAKIYFDNKLINLDGSMSKGYRSDPDRGFVYRIS